MNIKNPLLRWSVAVLAVLMLTACGSPTSSPTTSSPTLFPTTSAPTTGDTVQKAQTGQVTFNVQFPQAALKKALMDDRTASIIVEWQTYSPFASGSTLLTPDPVTGIASATLDVPVGTAYFSALARDSSGAELDIASTAGEITSGSNTVYLTFLSGDWQFVDDNDNPLPQSFGATTLAGFSLKSGQAYGSAAKATIDPSKPRGWSDYELQWQNDTPTAIGPPMWADHMAQFNAPAATGSSLGSDWLNITDPARSDINVYVQGDRLVWILDWKDGDGPATITDAANNDLIPGFRTAGDSQVLDGNHLGGHLLAATFESYTPIVTGTNVDCNLFWLAQSATPAAARAAAIKANLTKAAGKAAVGDETILTADTATKNYAECNIDWSATEIDLDGDSDKSSEPLTYDANSNWRYDVGDNYEDWDNDGHWDYAYHPGTSYDVTEQYSNIVAREFRAKGSQAGSVYDSGGGSSTPPPAAFSMEWLSGKTFYVVWFGEGRDPDGNPLTDVPVVLQVTFNPDGTTTDIGLMNENDGSGTYGVTASGLLYDDGDTTSGNTIVSGSTDQYIKTHYTVNGVLDNVDLLFYNQAEATAFASTLTASIPPSPITPPASAAAMIGSWIRPANVDGNAVIMTILDEATYTLIEEDPSGTSTDFEYGNFDYDSVTGTFTPYLLVDTNPSSGPSGAGGSLNVTISGDTMTIVGGPTFTKLAADPTKPIVGSWTVQEPNPTVVTFLADGTYYISQNAEVATGVTAGLERGTYSYSGTTLTATGIVRTLSGGGLAAPGMTTTINFTISGDNATFSDLDYSVSLKRVVAPATPAPLLGSWFMGSALDNSLVVITPIDGTRYVLGHAGVSDIYGNPGIEYGPYNYNGGFFNASPTIDTNGEWGFSNFSGLITPFQYSMVGIEDGPFFFHRIMTSVDYPLIGTWGEIDPTTGVGVVLTFLDDGSYMWVSADPAQQMLQPGNEWGTYSWDSTTGIITATQLFDLNGDAGFNSTHTRRLTVAQNPMGQDVLTFEELDELGNVTSTGTLPRIN